MPVIGLRLYQIGCDMCLARSACAETAFAAHALALGLGWKAEPEADQWRCPSCVANPDTVVPVFTARIGW